MYEIAYGSKCAETEGKSTTELAAMIRADIKAARKDKSTVIGRAPECVKFSIRSEYFSGGSAINIRIVGAPDSWYEDRFNERYGMMDYRQPTDELTALAGALKAVMNSYNYDGSEIQADYFNVRFYGSVYNEGGLVLA